MKVILKETIEPLGLIGSEVTVKKGYARNYLLPQNKAVLATPANRRVIEQEKKKFAIQIAKEKQFAEEIAQRLEGVTVKLAEKVSDEDRLYGSINVNDIAKALNQQGLKVEKRMVLLVEPIKTLGTYQIPIRIYTDVEPQITLEVVEDTAN